LERQPEHGVLDQAVGPDDIAQQPGCGDTGELRGRGGIGFLLSDRIGAYRWDEAWSIIFLIIAMVYLIDWLSGLIRARFIGTWEGTR
jgi:hypothetical protein